MPTIGHKPTWVEREKKDRPHGTLAGFYGFYSMKIIKQEVDLKVVLLQVPGNPFFFLLDSTCVKSDVFMTAGRLSLGLSAPKVYVH